MNATATATATRPLTFVERVAVVREAVELRIEAQDPREWSNRHGYEGFVATLRSVSLWRKDARTVVATVADTRAGRIHVYVAADALEHFPLEGYLSERARIDQTGPTTYTLTF